MKEELGKAERSPWERCDVDLARWVSAWKMRESKRTLKADLEQWADTELEVAVSEANLFCGSEGDGVLSIGERARNYRAD